MAQRKKRAVKPDFAVSGQSPPDEARGAVLEQELRRAQELLEAARADEERFRILFLKSPLGIGPADSEFRFLDVNEALCLMLGYTREELLGLTVLDITHPDDRPQYQSFWKDVISGAGRGLQTEKRYVKKDGTILRAKVTTTAITSPDSTFLYGLGIFEDITALKQAEEALRESEEKYRTVVENAAEAIVIAQDDRLKFVNRMATKISGYSEPELYASPFLDLVHPDDRAMMGERYLKSLESDASPLKYAFRLVNKDGSVKWAEINAVLVAWKGKPATLNFLSDITERKRAEEALLKSESNLRALAIELSRAEERERQRLALFLHDEIGQSLALLRMKLGSLAGAAESKSAKNDLHKIRDLMEKVIDQTHTLTFELSPPILHQLGLEAAVEWAGEKIGRDHGLQFVFSDDGMSKPLDADFKALLFRCVRELLVNIVKHAKARKMTVSLKRTQDQFCAVVEDDGIGFETSLLERRLDVIGFGLFSIREHLAAMGGTFELRSEPGRGTRATVCVPLKEEKPASRAR